MAVELSPSLTNGLFGYKGTLARVTDRGRVAREILEDISDADWNADGSQLAIIREPPQDQTPASRRVEYPVGTTIFETPAPKSMSHLRVSPDGRRVAFIHHPVAGADDGEVIITDTSGKPVTRSSAWSTAQGLAWRPDGREVWFTAAKTGGVRVLHALQLERPGPGIPAHALHVDPAGHRSRRPCPADDRRPDRRGSRRPRRRQAGGIAVVV